MQGLWKTKSYGWHKDSKRKKVSKKRFLKSKAALYRKIALSDIKKREIKELPETIWKKPNEYGKNELYYNEKPHPLIAYIMLGSQFSKKPYKKVQHGKGRAKVKGQLQKLNREYKESAFLIGLSLAGTYGLDSYFDISDKVVDLDFENHKSIDLEID